MQTDVEKLQDCLEQARTAQGKGLVDVAESIARRALAVYGTGPWTTDYRGWNEAAAEAAYILAATLVRRCAYVACIAELGGTVVQFDWHDGLWACLIDAHREAGSLRRATEVARQAARAVGIKSPLLAQAVEKLSAPSHRPAYPPTHGRRTHRARSRCQRLEKV